MKRSAGTILARLLGTGLLYLMPFSLIIPELTTTQLTAQTQDKTWGITAVEGITVGHHTMSDRPTGCTVILTGEGAIGGVDVRGGAPGTVETDLLNPVNSVKKVHGIVLSGGSAFGLSVRDGVMSHLNEKGIGYRMGSITVPIVAGAVLYDLSIGDKPDIHPDADCGYQAASRATTKTPAEGNVGAGSGATVGKSRGLQFAMKGGIGTASTTLPNGLTVGAIVAVNSVGDIIDPSSGAVIAGTRTADGLGLADARILMREGLPSNDPQSGTNTTIGVVATNAVLTKAQVTKVGQMAHDGIARAIYPAHTTGDGDTVFSLATGTFDGKANVSIIGTLAADMTVEAILRAVLAATSIEGIPSVSDINIDR